MYLEKKRILFADDDPALAGVTRLSLERWGYDVKTVHSGCEALRLFCTSPHSFDLVILDQEMPDMKGTEVAEQLSALHPDTPILLYTGCDDADLNATARAAGIRDIAEKSSAIEDLLRLVDSTFVDLREKPGYAFAR